MKRIRDILQSVSIQTVWSKFVIVINNYIIMFLLKYIICTYVIVNVKMLFTFALHIQLNGGNFGEAIEDKGNKLMKFSHFWKSTGFCPPDPKWQVGSYLQTEDVLMNLSLIGALPFNGIKYVRIHWLLNAIISINLNTRYEAGNYKYNFTYLDNILGHLNKQKLYPIFELMGLPLNTTHYSPENSYKFWYDLTQILLTRYSKKYEKKLSKWKFETWNEPDLKGYNILNFTLPDYLNYARGISDALSSFNIQNVNKNIKNSLNTGKKMVKLGGPAGLFKDKNKHKLCWGVLKYCQNNSCPFDYISFHAKGDEIAENVFKRGSEIIKTIKEEFPNLPAKIHSTFANDESDILVNWSKNLTWRADVRYAAMAIKIISDHYKGLVITNQVKKILLSFDNAFLSYSPHYFTQRTLLARFQMNNTNPKYSFFVNKPIYTAMGLLSYLGEHFINTQETSKDVVILATKSIKHSTISVLISRQNNTEEDGNLIKQISMSIRNVEKAMYAIYLLDNERTNPFLTWIKNKSPNFPDSKLRQLMKEVERPFILKSPTFINNKDLNLTLFLRLPSVALINICLNSGNNNRKTSIGRITHLVVKKVTKNEVLLLWKDDKLKTKCIKTYEVEFRKTDKQQFKRINKEDIIFPSYYHFQTIDKENGIGNGNLTATRGGEYRVRAVDYWGNKGKYKLQKKTPNK